MKSLALIVPTRGRPHNIKELAKSLEETNSTQTDLILVLDSDDPKLREYLSLDITSIVYPRTGKGMAKPLNRASYDLRKEYKYFAFMGDDHRPRTLDWDSQFIDELDRLGTGLVYGNDLHQGERLPTAVAMTGNIVRVLGGMVPPGMIHLYLDNFWLKLGQDLKAITYLPDTIIEHCHPVWGTAKIDAGYQEVNAPEIYSADKIAFESYINSQDYQDLLAKLR